MNTAIIYDAQPLIDYLQSSQQIIIIADACTNGFCVPIAKKIIPHLQFANLIVIPKGEANKNEHTVNFIYNQLYKLKATKQTIIVNIGGGMVSDIGAIVASTYKRGLPVVNIPTTLLAINDASFGGKCGYNFNDTKNIIGSFYESKFTYINPLFLNSLAQRELQSGIAEMIKHALIANENYWIKLKSINNFNDFIELENIQTSISIKTKFVDADFNDNAERQLLNFGHTIGHALESFTLNNKQPLLHGEAVMLGMIAELYIAQHLFDGLDKTLLQQVIDFKNKWFRHLNSLHFNETKVIDFILQDKKNDNDSIHFSLIKNIAVPAIKTQVPTVLIQEAIHFLNRL
jgi:3-dehydroquinate synthase